MSSHSKKSRGVKRVRCSCNKCDSIQPLDNHGHSSVPVPDSVPGSSRKRRCESIAPPSKRKRLDDSLSGDDQNILAELFGFNEDCRDISDDLGYENENDDSEYNADEAAGEERGRRSESVNNRGSNYGTNMYNGNERGKRKGLRPIVIDGSNVAMGHTNGRYFSCKGLKICADYFLEREHRIYVIVPHYRQCKGQARDQYILRDLYHKGHLYFTPSRMVDGRLEVPYDDRYIVQLAAATGGVIVSSDRYRDLLKENPRWEETIKNRLLMFTWVDDILFFPQDPFGKRGPTLDELLHF